MTVSRIRQAAVTVLVLAACKHATTTDLTHAESEQQRPADVEPADGGRRSSSEMPSEGGVIATPGHPILSVSARDLRKPGGTEKLRAALAKSGDLANPAHASEHELRDAIKRFQGKNGLAQTGFADHQTISKLGLDPDEIDRSEMPRVDAGDGG